MARLLTRRRVLCILGGIGACGAYPFVEPRLLKVTRTPIALPRLPRGFAGLRIALMSDFHYSSSVPLSLIERAVARAQEAKPDLILLGGDYVSRRKKYIAPCLKALGALRAPLGVFAVLGNHDHWQDAALTRTHLEKNGIQELRNRGVWLRRGDGRLRLGGVGDLWEDAQDIETALGDCRADEGAIVLSHDPDFAEQLNSARVDLLLSGHTHGGQVHVPILGPPIVPSDYGRKYASGLVHGPRCLVFVTNGVGTVGPPVRFACRPEVSILELTHT